MYISSTDVIKTSEYKTVKSKVQSSEYQFSRLFCLSSPSRIAISSIAESCDNDSAMEEIAILEGDDKQNEREN